MIRQDVFYKCLIKTLLVSFLISHLSDRVYVSHYPFEQIFTQTPLFCVYLHRCVLMLCCFYFFIFYLIRYSLKYTTNTHMAPKTLCPENLVSPYPFKVCFSVKIGRDNNRSFYIVMWGLSGAAIVCH